MKKRATHNKLTKQMFPWMDPKVIDMVNKAIDTGDSTGKAVSSVTRIFTAKDPVLRLGVKQTGHRVVNHDWGVPKTIHLSDAARFDAVETAYIRV